MAVIFLRYCIGIQIVTRLILAVSRCAIYIGVRALVPTCIDIAPRAVWRVSCRVVCVMVIAQRYGYFYGYLRTFLAVIE